MKRILPVLLCLLSGSIHAQEFTCLRGDYLGQTPPTDSAIMFAEGIISTDDQEHGVPAFSPDGSEVFWTSHRPPGPQNENWLRFIKTMRQVKGRWTEPEPWPYGSPAFSPDGKRLYMGSKGEGFDPYYVEKQGSAWSEPVYLKLVSRYPEIKFAYFPTITSRGTIYFLGYVEGQWHDLGLYRAELYQGEYARPEMLPPKINNLENVRNWMPYISPDESYLIFCSTRGLPKSDKGDLFISFRKKDLSWTEPVNMGETINTKAMERYSTVSPDGKYLFFTRDFTHFLEDVFWVRAKIIDDLKREVFHSETQ